MCSAISSFFVTSNLLSRPLKGPKCSSQSASKPTSKFFHTDSITFNRKRLKKILFTVDMKFCLSCKPIVRPLTERDISVTASTVTPCTVMPSTNAVLDTQRNVISY